MLKILFMSLMCYLISCAGPKMAKIHKLENESIAIDEFNVVSKGEHATILFNDGTSIDCDNIQISQGLVSWEVPAGKMKSSKLVDIKRIVIFGRGKGVVYGFGQGALIGIGATFLGILSVGGNPVLAAVIVRVFALKFIVSTAIVGGAYGFIVGYSDTYESTTLTRFKIPDSKIKIPDNKK